MKPSIPFIVQEIESSSYHPIVSGSINGTAISLILDTGASRTVIDSALTNRFPTIENQNQETFAAGINAQKMEVRHVEIPSITFGKIEFTNLTVFSTDLSAISDLYERMAGMKIHGLIGCDFLEQHKANIDFEKRVIKLGANPNREEITE
jgi:predicted aspartyl protease